MCGWCNQYFIKNTHSEKSHYNQNMDLSIEWCRKLR